MDTNTFDPVRSRPAAQPGAPDGLSADVLWEVLVHHSGAWVVLVDDRGVIVDISQSALVALETTREQMVGKSLGEALPGDLGKERVAFVQRAIELGRPVSVEAQIAGSMRRCVLYPIAPGAGRPGARVLITSRPCEPGGPPPDFRSAFIDRGPLDRLTDRELDVLRLIAQGHSTTRIAKELHRSVKTVEWHRVSLGDKLGVTNRVELARIAIRAGLVSVDDSGPDLDEPGTGE